MEDLERDVTPVDANRSGLLAAILVWTKEDDEPPKVAAKRLGVRSDRFFGEMLYLLRDKVIKKTEGVLRRGTVHLVQLSRRNGKLSEELNQTLQHFLGDIPIEPGKVYDLEQIANAYRLCLSKEAKTKSSEGGP